MRARSPRRKRAGSSRPAGAGGKPTPIAGDRPLRAILPRLTPRHTFRTSGVRSAWSFVVEADMRAVDTAPRDNGHLRRRRAADDLRSFRVTGALVSTVNAVRAHRLDERRA